MSEISKFFLSEEENEKIFRRNIVPLLFKEDDRASPERPVAIILGGQPGAGKSYLQEISYNELNAQGPTVKIEGDRLRPFHPAHGSLQRQDPAKSSMYTSHDASVWFQKAINEAQVRKVNIVAETTMRSPNEVLTLALRLKTSQYRVEARVLAVNERFSWLGANFRFERQLARGQAGRIPPKSLHDAAVSGLVESVRLLEKKGIVDRIIVEKRGGQRIYDNSLEAGGWRDTPRATVVIQAERDRLKTSEEVQAFREGWRFVVSAMEKRHAPESAVKEIKSIADQDINFFEKQREKVAAEKPRRQKP